MNDLVKYKFCIMYARTMLMMAKVMKDIDEDSFKSYIQRGKESCYMAQRFKDDWDSDSTVILKLVA